jgi:hypothetical protein
MTESSWYPEYLDVYVHQEKFKQLLQGLHRNGFTSVTTVVGEEAYSGNEVSRVVRASNALEGHVIDVIMTRSPSPIAPLFQCHSSLDMNYVSADTFFSAYLTLSCCAVGFPNLLLEFRKCFTTGTLLLYEKHRSHGFCIRSPIVIWINNTNE